MARDIYDGTGRYIIDGQRKVESLVHGEVKLGRRVQMPYFAPKTAESSRTQDQKCSMRCVSSDFGCVSFSQVQNANIFKSREGLTHSLKAAVLKPLPE